MPEHTKRADERARKMAEWAGLPLNSPGWQAFVGAATHSLMEHARDQRRLCAEAVPTFDDAETVDPNPLTAHSDALNDAHAAVMNAPEPGNHNV